MSSHDNDGDDMREMMSNPKKAERNIGAMPHPKMPHPKKIMDEGRAALTPPPHKKDERVVR